MLIVGIESLLEQLQFCADELFTQVGTECNMSEGVTML